jgi:hypothetical protein
VIPSDHKWYRNHTIAKILIEVLGELHQDYPAPDLNVDELRARLEEPR